MKKFSYTTDLIPKDYKCSTCNATNCKLWREYQCFGEILLDCVDCATKSQNNPNISPAFARAVAMEGFAVAEDGKYRDSYGQRCDQIGWRVPAVPTEDSAGYWGYSSVPQAGVNWWVRLPLRNKK